MRLRDPNNVERAVQTDPTLLRYSSAIAEQIKRNVGSFWLKRLTGFKLCATTPGNRQHLKICKTCNRVRKLTQNKMLRIVGQQCSVRLHGA